MSSFTSLLLTRFVFRLRTQAVTRGVRFTRNRKKRQVSMAETQNKYFLLANKTQILNTRLYQVSNNSVTWRSGPVTDSEALPSGEQRWGTKEKPTQVQHLILVQSGSGSPNFFVRSEGHISCYSTVRGPDILNNVTVLRYVTFYQVIKYFAIISSLYCWQNVFAGRMKWLRGPHLAYGS